MPNIRIPLITGRPGPSAPPVTAEAFGAAQARGLGSLAQGIETGVRAVTQGLSEIVRVDQQIEDAKQDQILWEKTAQGQASIDEARFNAEDAVPSEASLNGQAQTQIKDPKTLQQEYESLSDASISKLGEGLSGLRLEQFESRMRIAKQDGLIQIRQVQRARDIDEGRASFARQEEILLSRAADANADIEQIIAEKKAAGDSAKEGGLYKALQIELNFQAFEKDARKTHEVAQFNAQVNATVDGMMAINLPKNDRVAAVRAAIPDGPLQDEVVKRVKQESDEEQGRVVQGQKDAAERSWKSVREGGGQAVIERGVTEKQRRLMDEFIRKRAKRAADGATFTILTKPNVYEEILQEALTDPDAFSERNLLDDRMSLSDKDFNFWDKMQGKMTTDPNAAQGLLNTNQLITKGLDQSKIDNDDQRTDLTVQIHHDIIFENEKRAKENKSPMDATEEAVVVNRRVFNATVERDFSIFSDEVPLGKLTVKDRERLLSDERDPRIDQIQLDEFERVGVLNPTAEQLDIAVDEWLTIHGVPGGEAVPRPARPKPKVRQTFPIRNLPTPDVAQPTIDVSENFTKLRNPDGTVSTVLTFSFEENGVEILIPQVVDGVKLTRKQAKDRYRRTGLHFGKFSTPAKANAFASKLHDVEEAKP